MADIDKRAEFFMSLAQQLVAYILKFVSKQEFNNLKTLLPPDGNNSEAVLVFIDKLMRITTNTTIKNVTNVHYANALQIFSETVHSTLPQQTSQSWYDELDAPYQNIKRHISKDLFCISLGDYQILTNRIK